MASRELYSSIGKPKKRTTFGNYLGDYGRLIGDNMLSVIGMSDIIGDDSYKTDVGKKVSQIMNPIAGIVGQVGLAAATGGTGNAALSAAKAVGPSIFAKGGLRTFEGNTHEQGGIQLGQDEVEMGETMMPIDIQSDFIFSDRLYPIKSISSKGKPTFGKQSFAQISKRINKPLEIRPNDAYSKRTIDRKLSKLAQEQEALKSVTPMKAEANHMAMGGKRYWDGGTYSKYLDFNQPRPVYSPYTLPKLEDEEYVNDIPSFDTVPNFDYAKIINESNAAPITVPEATFGMYNEGINKMTPKGLSTPTATETFKAINIPTTKEPTGKSFKSNFLPTALGYAAQAATNIPAMFMKPDKKTFGRVKFGDTNLAESRNEARRARNLGLATARSIAGQSGDTGQAMNYLAGTTAGLNNVYGNQFNQSLLQEKEMNLQSNMREQLANSQIEQYEENINTAEEDAIRNIKMQALSNMGTTAAMAGKDYMVSQGADAQINALMASNPDYTYKIVNGKLVPVRIKAMGGKRGKA